MRSLNTLIAASLLVASVQMASGKENENWVVSWTGSVQGPYPVGNPSAQPDQKFAFPDPAAGARDLGFDQQLSTVGVAHLGPHDRAVGTGAHERIVGRAAKALERRQVREGLDEVRLALAVVADDSRDAIGQRQRRLYVVAKEIGRASCRERVCMLV